MQNLVQSPNLSSHSCMETDALNISNVTYLVAARVGADRDSVTYLLHHSQPAATERECQSSECSLYDPACDKHNTSLSLSSNIVAD